jgi:SAM-dependent methyltransferase
MKVIWHDLECGSYAEDLQLWRSLAVEYGDPILDVGAGTGRVALELARHGYRVTALDRDPDLLEELARRGSDLGVETVLADARRFELGDQFALCVMPMQTVQLLGGAEGRSSFLHCVRRHLFDGGMLAIAITDALELFDVSDGTGSPLPDICELGGVVYSSQPTAVRVDREGFVLERRRERVSAAGERSVTADRIRLDRVTGSALVEEAAAVGFKPAATRKVPPTSDYVGSEVVMLRA